MKAFVLSLFLALLCSLAGATSPAAVAVGATSEPSAATQVTAVTPIALDDCEHLHGLQAAGTSAHHTGGSSSHACCGGAALVSAPVQLGVAPLRQFLVATLVDAPTQDVSYSIDKPPKSVLPLRA